MLMCDGVKVSVRMQRRQGCLVAWVRTEPSIVKGLQMQQTQPDALHGYRMQRRHRAQSPGYESQDATLVYVK